MHLFAQVVNYLSYVVWGFGIPVGGETIPLVVIALLGTGVFLTLRLGFIQVRRLGHVHMILTQTEKDRLVQKLPGQTLDLLRVGR